MHSPPKRISRAGWVVRGAALGLAGMPLAAAPLDGGAAPPLPSAATGGVEEIDLSAAHAEATLAPAETFTLPLGEFPEAVLVDLPRRKAYATTTLVAINIFSIASTVWFEALILGVAAPAAWWFRRTLGRPQQVGRTYCRRCNYDLTDLAGERCPECGAALSSATRMPGRRRWPRLALAGAIFLAAAGAYAALVRTVPRLVWPERWPAWWSETLDDLAEANSKYEWLIQHSSVLSRVHELDLDAGGASRTLWTGRRGEADHVHSLSLAADGSVLCLWTSASLRVWSIADRRLDGEIAFSDPLLAPLGGAAAQVQFSADGRSALLIGDSPRFIAMLIDLEAERERWRIESNALAGLEHWRVLHGGSFDRFLIAGDRPDTGETALSEWFVEAGREPALMRRFATSAYGLGPRLARHGYGPLVWASDMERVEAWNLQTEAVERRIILPHPVALLAAPREGDERLIITMFADTSRTWIVEPRSGRVVAELEQAPHRTRAAEILSDGRTLALWGYNDDQSQRVLSLYSLP